MKKTRVILSSEAEEVYKYLKKEAKKSKTERTILTAFAKKVEIIKSNPHYGKPIASFLHLLLIRCYLRKRSKYVLLPLK